MTELEYAKSYLKKQDIDIKMLAGDASSRKYFRIFQNEKTYILMNYSNDKNSVNDFLEVQSLLTNNKISCPKIIDHHQESSHLLLEDLTDYSLEEAFKDNNYINYYREAVKLLAKLHGITNPSKTIKKRSFDHNKLFWEMEFAIEHINKLFKIVDVSARKELSGICHKLESLPQVICHRDFHSRNLMIKDGKLYFIDFQDARMGSWQYDVVSLLHDSYVSLSKDEINELLNLYRENVSFEFEKDWEINFNLQLLQRTFKACGSFASLKNNKGSDRYLQYLPKCFNLLISISNEFPNFKNYISTIINSDKGVIK